MYVIAVDPTVPNWIVVPSTVPLMSGVPSVDRSIEPLSLLPLCVHVSVNVPLNEPL